MKIGISQIEITPQQPVWMVGYANRDHKSQGTYSPLYGGAIYLEGDSDRSLIITADVIGYTPPYDGEVRQAIADVSGLLPRQIALTATHTHCAPFLSPWNMPGEVEPEYAAWLIDRLQAATLQAMQQASAGRIGTSRTQSTFGVNRRRPQLQADGTEGILFAPHPDGPIDRDLDTLWFYGDADRLLGSLTIYGCHPTSIGGYEIGADYPGYLCQHLGDETKAPALFATGCAGDVRPWFGGQPADEFPRPELEELKAAGISMASDVIAGRTTERAIDASGLAVDHLFHGLPYDRRMNDDELQATASGDDPWLKAWAELMQKQRAHGALAAQCPHEIQIIRFGDDLQIVFLGGEVLSEIGLHLKQELSPSTTITIAYANGLIAYVPSANAHPLGGYEVDGSHHYFRRPARFTAAIEDLIVVQTKGLSQRLGS